MADTDTHQKAQTKDIVNWTLQSIYIALCGGTIFFIVFRITKKSWTRWQEHRRSKAARVSQSGEISNESELRSLTCTKSTPDSTVYEQPIITTPGHAISDMNRDTRNQNQPPAYELQDLEAQTYTIAK
ncbi:hypothetical protein N7540_007103 [Penicillium herquei]|nr:hypothetical protein N7540_007103 [Penicillium herquei]